MGEKSVAAEGQRVQFGLGTLLLGSAALCPVFALIGWRPVLGVGTLVAVLSVGGSAILAWHARRGPVRFVVVAGQMVTFPVNLIFGGFALLVGFMSLVGNNQLSRRPDAALAVGAFGFGILATANAYLLVARYRPRSRKALLCAFLPSAMFLALIALTVLDQPRAPENALPFYLFGVSGMSVMVMRHAEWRRFFYREDAKSAKG